MEQENIRKSSRVIDAENTKPRSLKPCWQKQNTALRASGASTATGHDFATRVRLKNIELWSYDEN